MFTSQPHDNDALRHEAGTAPVLDPAALAKLRELDPTGRAGIVARVLRTYEASLHKLMAQFDEAAAAGNHDGLRHVAHTLRSSSASVGAMVLSAHCGEVEALIRTQGVNALPSALAAMKSESVRVAAAVRAMLADQGPAS